ncbi:putative sporulation protein YyaC [Alkalibacillus flavidus]|uniref:Sporulation protein YyaC n=1 Tax=Alkalibacillus flavidus TaxID=546021 RepID=A0ABV2KW92_9BACI
MSESHGEPERLIAVHYDETLACKKLVDVILHHLPQQRVIVILCIGTDRSTGDSFGPLTGSLLSQRQHDQLHIHGTLEHPVHAKNLEATIHDIHEQYDHPFIMAIDAALGSYQSQHMITIHKGELQPGAATKQAIPAVGDLSIKGIVNISGFVSLAVLQSTRLHNVMTLAKTLTQALSIVNLKLRQQSAHQTKTSAL